MLRLAGAGDLPAVVSLMNVAFRGTGPAASWNSEAAHIDGDRTTERLIEAELLAHPAAQLLVADGDSGDALVATVLLEPVGDGVWHLGSFTVDPALQNAGLGRGLLAEAEAWARERGARTMRMGVVNVRDTLIAWYLRRGYVLTGESEPFPYGDDRFGVPRRPDLAFTVLEKAL